MGFDAPAGTRGARQPRAGLMMRWVNKMAARRIRRTGTMMGLGSPGGPGESHPRAPTERSVTISRHSARPIPDLVRTRSSRPSGRTCLAALRSARATTSGLS
jgi:hypothetical protein